MYLESVGETLASARSGYAKALSRHFVGNRGLRHYKLMGKGATLRHIMQASDAIIFG